MTIRSVDSEQVRRCVDAYAARLMATRPDIEEIVVFGSFAKGNYAPGSDVDIFILLAASDKCVWDRIPGLLPGAFPVGVDLFPFTRQEVAERAGAPLLAEVSRSSWRYQRLGGRDRAANGSG